MFVEVLYTTPTPSAHAARRTSRPSAFSTWVPVVGTRELAGGSWLLRASRATQDNFFLSRRPKIGFLARSLTVLRV